eukprot:6473360-Amphidinium_carterae.1
MVKYSKELNEARLSELSKLFELKCFARKPKNEAVNLVDTRWIYRWKIQEGKKQIKARVTLRGFMDRAAEGANYAGTANKTAQRIVSSACMWHPAFRLSSIDISSAFARGMTFKELEEM